MSDRVRVLSANLWNGAADPGALAELVEKLRIDVVCAQELGPEQAEALAGVLPHGELKPALDHNGIGIALRRPAGVSRVELPRRDALVAQLDPADWPGLCACLEIVSVHVVGPHSWPFHTSWPQRREQLRRLERYLTDASPGARLLVGDLNATPVWRVYRRLTRHLEDAAVRAARRRGRRPSATWGPTWRWPRLLRIDHALVAGSQVEDVQIVTLPGGDHSGLLVELSPAT